MLEKKELKGCVHEIFSSLFFKTKRKHLQNYEKCFLISIQKLINKHNQKLTSIMENQR